MPFSVCSFLWCKKAGYATEYSVLLLHCIAYSCAVFAWAAAFSSSSSLTDPVLLHPFNTFVAGLARAAWRPFQSINGRRRRSLYRSTFDVVRSFAGLSLRLAESHSAMGHCAATENYPWPTSRNKKTGTNMLARCVGRDWNWSRGYGLDICARE